MLIQFGVLRLVCTIFVLPKWLQKQRELEEMEQENQAMVLKTKKFVQFLSANTEEESVVNEDDSNDNVTEDKDDVEENNEDEISSFEEKKVK